MEPEPHRVGPRDFVAEIVDEVHLQAQQAPNQIKNRNESKQARARGEAYVDRKGNVRRERGLQVGDCSKCRLDCSTIFLRKFGLGSLGNILSWGIGKSKSNIAAVGLKSELLAPKRAGV